jgi:hypothetical protein
MKNFIESIKYNNTITGRKGLLIDCMKIDFVAKNIEAINEALKMANDIPLRYSEKFWSIQVVKFPQSYDRDFQWRTKPEKYILSVTDKYGAIFTMTLKK